MDNINNNPGKDNEDIGPLGNALLSHLQEYYSPSIKDTSTLILVNNKQIENQKCQ